MGSGGGHSSKSSVNSAVNSADFVRFCVGDCARILSTNEKNKHKRHLSKLPGLFQEFGSYDPESCSRVSKVFEKLHFSVHISIRNLPIPSLSIFDLQSFPSTPIRLFCDGLMFVDNWKKIKQN